MNVKSIVEELSKGGRLALSQAITVCESRLSTDRAMCKQILKEVEPTKSIRVGFTGAPGVGKSSLIQALCLHILDLPTGHQEKEDGRSKGEIAVLTVDPSSPHSGGSILADKMRMSEMLEAAGDRVYVRPSPSSGDLGGVTRSTCDAIGLCERTTRVASKLHIGAGFGTVLVETVGVGQGEWAVKQMVDVMVLVVAPRLGDDFQVNGGTFLLFIGNEAGNYRACRCSCR